MLTLICIFLFFMFIYIFSNTLFSESDKYKNIILLMILFIFTFNPSLGHEQYLMGELNPIRINTITVAIFSCLLVVINKMTFRTGKEILFFLPLLLIFIFDFIVRTEDYYKFFSITFTYLSIYFLFLIVKSIKYLPVEKILNAVTILALINALLSILQYVTGLRLLLGSFSGSILYTEGAEVAKRAIGLAGTNNSAGNFGALLFAVILYNFIKKKSLFNGTVLVLTTLASILTFTRIGYIAIIIQLIIFFLFSKAKTKMQSYIKIFMTCFAIPIIALIFYIFSDEIINKLFVERGNTQSSRFDQYSRVFDYIISNDIWFGIGTGQYRHYMYDQFSILDIDIHSQYLNVLAENGIFILILFVWFNIWIFFKALKNNSDPLLRILISSLFIGNLICANFNPNAHYYLVNVLYYLLMFILQRGTKNVLIEDNKK